MTKRSILGILAAVALLGCAGETGIRLVVRTDISVPAAMDTVNVTVYAGTDRAPLFQRANTFGSLTADSFPITVGVTPGDTYKTWVLFRIQGLLGSQVVVERWEVGQFVDGEISEMVVELQQSCLDNLCVGGEQCRDGACEAALRPTGWTITCGDGVPDTGEACDDGDNNSDTAADACRTTCVLAGCGDDVIDSGEQCDDGNTTAGDGCSASCQNEGDVCGNGDREGTEECDDGNTTDGDGCQNDCTFTCHLDTDCDDSDQCTEDTCDAVGLGQICHNNIDVGATCDDGNACTDGETCDTAGDCQGGSDICGACDPAADTCETDHGDDDMCNGTLHCAGTPPVCEVDAATVMDPGDSCDDTLFCNGADTCGGTPIVCQHAGDPCDTCQACNETGGVCDVSAGSCFIADTCYADGADDPTNACQECVAATSATAWTPKAVGITCDDADACTTGETCNGAGVCTGGTPSCDCDPAADTCEADHGDGDPCNGTLMCTAGARTCQVDPTTVLSVGVSCNDGIDCNGADACGDGAFGRECQHNGVSPCLSCETCADITGGHTCSRVDNNCIIAGTCYGRGAPNPADACQTCNDAVLATDWSSVTDGTACDDTLYCNGADTCTGGVCGHTGDPCTGVSCYGTCNETTDVCPVATGCYIASTCVAEGAANPANACQWCDSGANPLAWSNRAAGYLCDDTDPCTANDVCTTGTCAGTTGCTASPVLVGGNVRLCLTQAACDTLISGTCTSVNAPATWTTTSWDPAGNPMTACGGGTYYAATTTLAAGDYCYRFRPNAGATWYNDPLNADSGAGRCGGDNSHFVIP
jgi:cysteine-rich repeat protein